MRKANAVFILRFEHDVVNKYISLPKKFAFAVLALHWPLPAS
jgi:hypothetical protein